MMFPTHPQEIDTAWLAARLDVPHTLHDLAYAPIGTGQVADSYRLTLTWDNTEAEATPKSIIMKCPAADATSRTTAKNMHLYEIETNWYRTFARTIECRVPRPFYAVCSDDGADFILLLEDLAPAQQIDQMHGATLAEVQLALREAAYLHRFRWNDEGLRHMRWLNYTQENQAVVRDMLPAIYPEWCARYQTRLAPEILELGRALIKQYDRYQAARTTPLVIAHGDLRLDNMLYCDAQGRAVLLDWQTVSAGAPMSDVAYCISTSFASPTLRAAEEEKLIADYLARLHRNSSNVHYDDASAWHDYRYAAFSGFLMAVISAMVVERTARGDEMFAVMAERSAYQALHLDSLSLI